jgi:hypothetical protein
VDANETTNEAADLIAALVRGTQAADEQRTEVLTRRSKKAYARLEELMRADPETRQHVRQMVGMLDRILDSMRREDIAAAKAERDRAREESAAAILGRAAGTPGRATGRMRRAKK